MFVNEKPISLLEICKALDLEKKEVVDSLEELSSDYEERNSGLCVVKVGGGYQLCTSPKNTEWIQKLYKKRFKKKLSPAALEVLAIVAYKQPVTKVEVESIRGVSCDQVIKNLLNIGLLKIKGKKEVIGRPFLYGTSRKFLEYFGLNSLKDLPALDKNELMQNRAKDSLPPQTEESQKSQEEEFSENQENQES